MLQKPKTSAESCESVYSRGPINSNSVAEDGKQKGSSIYGLNTDNFSVSQMNLSPRVLFRHSKYFIELVNHSNM